MRGELPQGWTEVALSDVCAPVSQRGPNAASESFRYIDLSAIDNRAKRINVAASVATSAAPSRAKQIVSAGDVLFSTVRVYLENIAHVPLGLDGAIASTAFSVLRPGKALEPRYLYWLVSSKRFIQCVNVLQRGNSPPSVQDGDVRGQLVPLPPRSEQQRIVSRIEELFSEIDEGERASERAQRLLKRYRQSLLKDAVTGRSTVGWRHESSRSKDSVNALLERMAASEGVRQTNRQIQVHPRDATNLPSLPEGWAWARAEAVCNFITKGTTPAASAMHSDTVGIPFIKVYNLTFDGSLDFSINPTFVDESTHVAVLSRSRLLPGDVVMNIVGPPLGKVSIVPATHCEWNMNQAVCVFRPLRGLDKDFLAYYLLSRVAQDWLASRSKATVGQVNLTLEICRDLPIPIPSLPEQQEIVQLAATELARLDNLAASLVVETTRGKALRQSVLKAAFSGQLVPQDPADEPASVLLARLAAQSTETPAAPCARTRRSTA